MSRYEQLLLIIDLFKPKVIAETGVWNGQNAIRMIQKASQYGAVTYHGFDLFEDATAETDAAEFNVKPHNTVQSIADLLGANIREDTDAKLYKGDTNKTLQHLIADLAFIDGGHSISTIEHDYNALKDSSIVVLDDYYTPDEAGNCPDVTKFGCNQLVSKLTNYAILPVRDRVKGGGFTQFVMVIG